jgi:Cu/Ag efflux protein CusF
MKARQNKKVVSAHDAIAALLLDELQKVFRVQEQVRLI